MAQKQAADPGNGVDVDQKQTPPADPFASPPFTNDESVAEPFAQEALVEEELDDELRAFLMELEDEQPGGPARRLQRRRGPRQERGPHQLLDVAAAHTAEKGARRATTTATLAAATAALPAGLDAAVLPHGASSASSALRETVALLAQLAEGAVRAEQTAEAEGLAAAMVPLALQLHPAAYRALWAALPALVQGVVGLTRLLHAHPATRPALRLLPSILANTGGQLAWSSTPGRSLDQQTVARALAYETAAAMPRRPLPATSRQRRKPPPAES